MITEIQRMQQLAGINEIRVNNPSALRIIEVGAGDGLLVDNTYLFTDYIDREIGNQYKIIYADVRIVEEGQEYLLVYISEPSFGGGADQEEIDEAYDEYEENCAIAEKVLTPYSYERGYDYYHIKLDNVINADLLK